MTGRDVLVYLACPYTGSGGRHENAERAVTVGKALRRAGFCVEVPLLWHYAAGIGEPEDGPITEGEYLDNDLSIISALVWAAGAQEEYLHGRCGIALVRLPGESTGCEKEIAAAAPLGYRSFHLYRAESDSPDPIIAWLDATFGVGP